MISFAKGYRPEQEPQGEVCLFMGGSHDGKRIGIADTSRPVQLAVPKRVPVVRFSRESVMCEDIFECESYVPQLWRGGDNQRIIYVLEGMSSEVMLDALIAGYQGNKPAPVEQK